MPIKSGIGFGEAQVYNQPSALVNTYGKLLQQQAQENAKFQNELVDLISKVKTEGARDIDKPLITKAYDEIKELYRQASSVRNSSERNLIRSQLTSGIKSLNEAAARSAEEAKLYTDILGRVATTGQFLYDPNKLNEFKQRISKPITQLTAFNPLDLERIPDDSIRDKAFDNIYTELKNKSVYKTVNIGGGKEQEVGVVNPTVVTANIIERIGKSPEWLNLATRNYVQANPDKEPKIEDIIDNEVKLYMTRRGNEYVGSPSRIPTGGAGGQQQQAVYDRGALLDNLINRVPGSDKKFLEVSSLPYGTDVKFADLKRNGKVFRRIFKVVVPKAEWDTIVSANPSVANTFTFGKTDASGKAKVFEFDVESPDARRGLNVFIDQFSGGKNVPYDKVKKNNPTPSPKPAGKKYSDIQEKAIAVAMKDNTGATREQVIQALIQAGLL